MPGIGWLISHKLWNQSASSQKNKKQKKNKKKNRVKMDDKKSRNFHDNKHPELEMIQIKQRKSWKNLKEAMVDLILFF